MRDTREPIGKYGFFNLIRHWSSIQSEEIEACHRFGKIDRKTKFKNKKTIIRFVNRKHIVKRPCD